MPEESVSFSCRFVPFADIMAGDGVDFRTFTVTPSYARNSFGGPCRRVSVGINANFCGPVLRAANPFHAEIVFLCPSGGTGRRTSFRILRSSPILLISRPFTFGYVGPSAPKFGAIVRRFVGRSLTDAEDAVQETLTFS